LLLKGIGDTIRVSLTDNPVEEVIAGYEILRALGIRKEGVNFMNIAQEFKRLVWEHEIEQAKRKLPDNQTALDYLNEILPVEQFMKQCWLEKYEGYFWSEYNLSEESFSFRTRRPDENIQISRHFRYDRHPMHVHHHFQLNYVLSGNPCIETADETITLTRGDFCILAPELKHHIIANSDDVVLIKIYTRSSTFEQVFLRWLGENNILSEFYRRVLYENDTGSYLMFRTGDDLVMHELMLDMYREFMGKRPYSNIIVEGRLTEYFCRLVRDFSGGVVVSGDTGKSRNMGAIIKYIIEHHADVTLDSLAEASGYSKNHICRLLHRGTGKTFTQILNSARIDAADKLLLTTDMSIHDIAVHVGYNTIEHFYRVFREYRGTTPREWRESKHR